MEAMKLSGFVLILFLMLEKLFSKLYISFTVWKERPRPLNVSDRHLWTGRRERESTVTPAGSAVVTVNSSTQWPSQRAEDLASAASVSDSWRECVIVAGERRLGTGPMSVQVVSETWFPCSDLSFTPCRCTKNKIGDWLVDRGNLERDLASTATCVYAPAAVFAAPASISQLMHLRAVHFTTLSDPTISFQIFTNFENSHFSSVICTKR